MQHLTKRQSSTGYRLLTTGYLFQTTAIFDGAGQRVAEKAGGGLSIMVYDAGGKLAAEYAQVSPPTTGKIEYVTNNYQGSTSVVTDNGGAVTSRHDYLPFGEEIGASVGSRTTAKAFSQADMMRQKYAGMETDTATGMAHTLWRKQDNWSGRWTSPDPYGGSMTTADPQSFNRYTYCDNDPVNQVDLAGLYPADIGFYQNENAGVAATLEREISRRVGVLTSPGGIAYQEEQKNKEIIDRKNAEEAKKASGAPQSGRQTGASKSNNDVPHDPTDTLISEENRKFYRGRIATFLADPCNSAFIEELCEAAKSITGVSYSSVLDTFDRAIYFWTPVDGAHGGEAFGALAARINDQVNREKPSGSKENQRSRREVLLNQTTQTFIAETLHMVGAGAVYGDNVMANAMNRILVKRGLDTKKAFSASSGIAINNASIYWHPWIERAPCTRSGR